MSRKIDRRDFIKKSSTAICAAGLTARSGLSLAGAGKEGGKTKVVEVTHSGAVSQNRRIDKAAVRQMVQRGMKALTNRAKPWEQFIDPKDRVGLKINTLGRPLLYTHHELIGAVIEELLAFGVKENNIIVWDRFESHMKPCKFAMNPSGRGVRYCASEDESGKVMRYDAELVYRSEADNPERRNPQYGTAAPFSELFTKDCDKIINMAILKDHGLSGVTLCLKNLAFGLTGNNSRFHGPAHIGPFIADICAYEQVTKKVVLHLIDGLEGCYDNGPLPRDHSVIFAPKTLWLGTDPVALDVTGLNVIEAKRKEKGLMPLAASGRPVNHIELAAKKGIGTNDPKRIALKKIQVKG